ncbi:MAG: hypothetical protein H6970_06655 [Gammaproteobacteria bacterium]|nr:hypothetical protein [Gammaproteobacteria bacterium]MCP5459231.1 hypothetical protein [Gammaproteobacteria bacterium]
MMTLHEIDALPPDDRAVTRASHDYYRALLVGAPLGERRRLRQAWLSEIQRRWPDDWAAKKAGQRF